MSDAADSHDDRRQHVRRALRTTATVVLAENQSFDVRMVDIAQGGIGIVAAANPKSGTTFVIRWKMPVKSGGVLPVQAKVRVTHSVLARDTDGFKIGLQFVQLDAQTAAHVFEFVK
jgi:c-di-GMP-binding flagellar brake protein YcgR